MFQIDHIVFHHIFSLFTPFHYLNHLLALPKLHYLSMLSVLSSTFLAIWSKVFMIEPWLECFWNKPAIADSLHLFIIIINHHHHYHHHHHHHHDETIQREGLFLMHGFKIDMACQSLIRFCDEHNYIGLVCCSLSWLFKLYDTCTCI